MEFHLLKREPVEPPVEEGVFFIGRGAAYFNGGNLVWVTLVAECDDGSLSLSLACDGPHPNHWLDYELSCVGLVGTLGLAGRCRLEDHGEDIERFLLENGIAPGQRFIIAATYRCHRYSSLEYGEDFDSEIDWDVKDIEPWTPAQVLTAWERYFEIKAGWMFWDLVDEMRSYLLGKHPIEREPPATRMACRKKFKKSWLEDAIDTIEFAKRWMP